MMELKVVDGNILNFVLVDVFVVFIFYFVYDLCLDFFFYFFVVDVI